jgi:hypothetical protein
MAVPVGELAKSGHGGKRPTSNAQRPTSN